MKLSLIALSLILSSQVFAEDMSRTESYEESYREAQDGTMEYIGGCTLHQDYEGKFFDVNKTIVETYEPNWGGKKEDTIKKLSHVEKELLEATANGQDIAQFFSDVDDFTLEKVSSRLFKKLDLYRFNIGVGGGNGYYDFYARSVVKGKVHYEKLAHIFDGDVDFCDRTVWSKK